MTHRLSTLTLLFSLTLSLIHARNFFPCHPSKATPNSDVKCSRVVLPPKLCKVCPLRPTDREGSFIDCTRIYDSESPECHDALRQYVSENECDHVRAKAVEDMINGDEDARSVVDYFLYSVCEECCDCVPMGTTRTNYIALASAHKPDDPYLWKEARGNCPAHAQFDVCKVLPHVRYFTKPGGPEIDAPEACPLLRQWQNSDAASEWELNPEAEISSEIETFLRGMLNAIDCDNFSIWTTCHDMEEKQEHLVITDAFEDSQPQIPSLSPSSSPSPSASSSPDTDDGGGTTSPPTGTTSTTGSSTGTSTGTSTSPAGSQSEPPPSATPSAAVDDDNPSGPPASSTTLASTPASSTGVCFPSSAVVELRSGEMVTMRELKIGDWVRVSETDFSQVFLFTHRIPHPVERFVEIQVGNRTLTATPSHIVYANGIAVPAGEVKIGDAMRTMEGLSVVTRVRLVNGKGLYNPQTMDGDIVVNGVVVSTYTTTIGRYAAIALLAPLRGVFRSGWIGEGSVGGWFRDGYRSIVPLH